MVLGVNDLNVATRAYAEEDLRTIQEHSANRATLVVVALNSIGAACLSDHCTMFWWSEVAISSKKVERQLGKYPKGSGIVPCLPAFWSGQHLYDFHMVVTIVSKLTVSSTIRLTSHRQSALALEDLPMENLYAKAWKLRKSTPIQLSIGAWGIFTQLRYWHWLCHCARREWRGCRRIETKSDPGEAQG